MFPAKTTFDCMSDIQKLWQTPEENAADQNFNQLLFRSTPHRSSGSTDSTSPESYSDNFYPQEFNNRYQSCRPFECPTLPNEFQTFQDMSLSKLDTLYPIRQRPILGRRTLLDPNTNENQWQIPEKNRSYELFPLEKSFDFTPPKNPSPPISKMHTPRTVNVQKISPIMNPINFERPASSLGVGESKICTFCKKNGERPKVYMTHWVKEKVGSKYVVTCPILRSHVCSTCGESGDNAHTITYCPVLRNTNNGKPLQSTTITLKNTRVLSNGRKRF